MLRPDFVLRIWTELSSTFLPLLRATILFVRTPGKFNSVVLVGPIPLLQSAWQMSQCCARNPAMAGNGKLFLQEVHRWHVPVPRRLESHAIPPEPKPPPRTGISWPSFQGAGLQEGDKSETRIVNRKAIFRMTPRPKSCRTFDPSGWSTEHFYAPSLPVSLLRVGVALPGLH